MESSEHEDECSWFDDSDSDDSIVVTLSQMQDEAAKLQSSAAEIREKLSGLLTELDDIGQIALKDRSRKHGDSESTLKDISGDEEVPSVGDGADAFSLRPVEEGEEASDSDDRYHDVSTSPTEDCRVSCSGDAATSAVGVSKPYDPKELLETIIDAVQMERQSGAGDSVEAHPRKLPSDKQDPRVFPKSTIADGPGVAGDVDAKIGDGGSDSDDADVVTGPAVARRDGGRRRRRTRKPTSDGDQSSDGRSSSTVEEPCLDAEVGDTLGLVDGPDQIAYRFE